MKKASMSNATRALSKKDMKKGMMSIDEILEITELDIKDVQALEQAKTIKK
jgi:hypothetical protein